MTATKKKKANRFHSKLATSVFLLAGTPLLGAPTCATPEQWSDEDIDWHQQSLSSGPWTYDTEPPDTTKIHSTNTDALVGIGTTQPGSKLHVQDSNVFDTPTGAITMARYWNGATDTRASSLFHVYSTASQQDSLHIGVSGNGGSISAPNDTSQTKMVVEASGKVGIGTKTPRGALDINGTGSKYIYLKNTYFADTGDNLHITQTGDIYFENPPGNHRLSILSDGNVGINTATPGGKLHVQGDDVKDIPAADVNISRYWNNNTDTRASSLFHVYSTTSDKDSLHIGVSGNGGSTSAPNSTAQTKMVIEATGNVGIGTTAPGQRLDIATGNGRVASGYSWLTNSDARYKKNITQLKGALNKIGTLRGVRYDLRADPDSVKGNGKHIGVIAQDVEKEYPEMVVQDENGYKAVAYDQLNALTIEAIKELRSHNSELKANNEALRKRVEKLEVQQRNRPAHPRVRSFCSPSPTSPGPGQRHRPAHRLERQR